MKNKIYALLLLCCMHTEYGQQYIYPVAALDDTTLFIMHQKSADCLELWSWNIKTQLAFKELSSLYIPAQITLLPSKKAYSFLDRGSLRIKSFEKRSPKTIEFYESIQDLQTISWIDDQTFYVTARYKKMYKPFLYTIEQPQQGLQSLVPMDDSVHYMFPNKIDNELFCIALTAEQEYQLVKTKWNPQPLQNTQSDHKVQLLLTLDKVSPSCFLYMENKTHGFLLTMQKSEHYSFTCYEITLQDNVAALNNLFTFSIPYDFMLGDSPQRLYESIYPFLPRYTQEYIYFTHYNQHNRCLIYEYNRDNQSITPINMPSSYIKNHEHIFSPLVHPKGLFVGYSCNNSDYQLLESIAATRYQIPYFSIPFSNGQNYVKT